MKGDRLNMTMSNVYILFTCDEWKTRDSYRLIGVATTIDVVRDSIKDLLIRDSIEINTDRNIDDMDIKDFQNYLTFFHVERIPLNSIEVDGNYFG